ncbi:MAG: hypothetical protein V7L14_30495 [Nostoc sp.]
MFNSGKFCRRDRIAHRTPTGKQARRSVPQGRFRFFAMNFTQAIAPCTKL